MLDWPEGFDGDEQAAARTATAIGATNSTLRRRRDRAEKDQPKLLTAYSTSDRIPGTRAFAATLMAALSIMVHPSPCDRWPDQQTRLVHLHQPDSTNRLARTGVASAGQPSRCRGTVPWLRRPREGWRRWMEVHRRPTSAAQDNRFRLNDAPASVRRHADTCSQGRHSCGPGPF